MTGSNTTSSDTSPLFDRKVDLAIEGLQKEFSNLPRNRISNGNDIVIAEYIFAMKIENNPSDTYRKGIIRLLCSLSGFFHNQKSFKQITRQDVLSFLDRLRKPDGSDPLHKWIATYNIYTIHLMRFLKWLYFSEIEPRPKPLIIENIPK